MDTTAFNNWFETNKPVLEKHYNRAKKFLDNVKADMTLTEFALEVWFELPE